MASGNQQVAGYPVVYDRDQLKYLVHRFLWYSTEPREMRAFKWLALCTFDSDTFMELLPENDLRIFQIPLEEVPLHVNSDDSFIKAIVSWRLDIGR